MTEKFIKNEQFNFIKKQVALIKDSIKKHVPPTVLNATIGLANAKALELFPHASAEQITLLDLSNLKTEDQFEQYLQQLSAYVIDFPHITEQQLKKMFPKSKKLKLPDLSNLAGNKLTYLGWNDLRTNKKYLVYELDGKLVGIECKMSAIEKNNICSICNGHGEVTYFSTITKSKKANNPDYYKAIGNLICTDSNKCNEKITNVDYLEIFLKESLGIEQTKDRMYYVNEDAFRKNRD
ncbi:FusB/FusC family EF-G-binding protein [Robertmurraya sp. FSL W8-0741]|uniref:FusB/FusC family EF-G-binding protein n=1 Tax=Robertmurraya sp. FSL W8-0741 TaxID=2954629 RepID=UPI000BA5D614|nr:elongation factor G-binding protein [Bacillus sp. 7504-2]